MRYFAIGIMCVIMLCQTGFSAGNASVVTILSSDTDIYKASAAEFKKYLQGNGISANITEYNLKVTDPEEVTTKIMGEKPSLIFVLGPQAAKLAKEKFTTVPIVYCHVFDATEYNTANMTGITLDIPAAYKIEQIKKILPQTKKIGMVYSSRTAKKYDEYAAACGKMGLQLVGSKVDTEAAFYDAFRGLIPQMDCYVMLLDQIYSLQAIKYVLLEEMKGKFPVVGLSSFYTKAGALLSFDSDYGDVGAQAGEIAGKILNGTPPQDIKPQFPRKAQYSLNIMVAEKIGVVISSQVQASASEVFGK